MKQAIITHEGKDTGRTIELHPDVFHVDPNDHVMYLDVKRINAAQRQGTHKTKERGEVQGSTRKIQKQKGTGNARRGAITAGILRGGGRIHGPRPHRHDIKINKKTSQLARRSALSLKAKNQAITVVENFTLDTPKTKGYLKILENLSCQDTKTLFVLPEANANLVLAGRNIPRTQIITAPHLNTYAILNAERLLLMESAVAAIQKQLT